MEWLDVAVLGVLVILLLAGLPVVWLYGRRRWLSRFGGLFDCSLRSADAAPGTGWVLGAACYSGENLEIFRIFALSFAPKWRFRRREIEVCGRRTPDPLDAAALIEGQHIAHIRIGDQEWEIALDPQSLTGLMSWLEAAPPGPRHSNL